MISHVLVGSPVPLAVQWLVAAMLFGGLLALIALRRRAWRVAAGGVAVLGLTGTVSGWVIAALQPGAPPYALRIVSPHAGADVPPTVQLTVCGVRGDGTLLPATDAQHYLVVFVDGHEVPTVDAWRFPVVLRPGAHSLRVELVTPAHHAFNPPATAQSEVRVRSGAQPPPPVTC